jgi:hypothetical protein
VAGAVRQDVPHARPGWLRRDLVVDREAALHQDRQRQQVASLRLAPGRRSGSPRRRHADFPSSWGKPPSPPQAKAHEGSRRHPLRSVVEIADAAARPTARRWSTRAVRLRMRGPDAVLGMVETSNLIRHAVRLSPIALTGSSPS